MRPGDETEPRYNDIRELSTPNVKSFPNNDIISTQ